MSTFFIGVIVVCGAGAFLWLVFGNMQQKDNIESSFTKPLEKFCRDHGFSLIPTHDKAQIWSRLQNFLGPGDSGGLLASTRDPAPEAIGVRSTQGRNMYVVLKRSVHHQSGGSRRFIAAIFIERGGGADVEFYATKKNIVNMLGSWGQAWIEVATVKDYVAYVRKADGGESGFAPRVLEILQQYDGQPPLAVHRKHEGIMVFSIYVGKWPDASIAYERLMQAGESVEKVMP